MQPENPPPLTRRPAARRDGRRRRGGGGGGGGAKGVVVVAGERGLALLRTGGRWGVSVAARRLASPAGLVTALLVQRSDARLSPRSSTSASPWLGTLASLPIDKPNAVRRLPESAPIPPSPHR